MEEGLNLDNIMSEEEISGLFANIPGDVDTEEETNTEPESGSDENTTKQAAEEEVNAERLFDSDPKSVGGEDGQGETPLRSGAPTSSKSNFYASTIGALVGDGVFTGLSEEDLAEVKDAESFANAVEKEVNSKLEARQKRLLNALDYGVNTDAIRQNEAISSYLDRITENELHSEEEAGVTLRRNLISQDLLNRGYSEQQIQRKVNDIFEAGKDIDEAKEALRSNKEYFESAYNNLLEAKKKEKEENEARTVKQSQELEKSILNDKNLLGGVSMDINMRKKVVENIINPAYKDESTNTYYTAIQKYQKEHPMEFIKNLGILYTLTDGFKSIDGIVKGKVKKEVKSHLKELEHTINSTSRNSDGSFNFVSGVGDEESAVHAGWKIDI